MKTIMILMLAMISSRSFALKLACADGPVTLTLELGERIEGLGIYADKYKVTGKGLGQTENYKDFETEMILKEVSTRAYYGYELTGEIPELKARLNLSNFEWYSHASVGFVLPYMGVLSNEKKTYNLVCTSQN